MEPAAVKHISEWFIKPKFEVKGSDQPYHLGPWDLAMLSVHYIQKGLLFTKPSPSDDQGQRFSTTTFLQSLRDSLSLTLVHFYPMAGQLATKVDQDRKQCLIFIDCNKGPGARFIHATVDLTISDILSPADVPLVVQSFFDHDRAVNHDGHTRPLLTVQVTELLDGIFIGCSINHLIGDGTSYWHFWNTWSEIHRENRREIPVSRLPIHKRWCPEGCSLPIPLPSTHPDEFINRYEAPKLRERIFHFSSESMARLKARANQEGNTTKISSFQAPSAHVWRSVVRVSRYPTDQVTKCRMAANNRHRLNPPLPREYCGNALSAIAATTTAGENLGWAALLLNQAVANHTDKIVRDFVEGWLKSPVIYQFQQLSDATSVMMGSSPRFDMYGNEFGLGKAIAVRSGYANKFKGKVSSYPGYGGGGSIDLEICLPPDIMTALETNKEFIATVSLPCNGFIATVHCKPMMRCQRCLIEVLNLTKSRNCKMNSATVKHISECFIKPKYEVEESKQPHYLSPWDLVMLSAHYIQKGLLFAKPSRLDDQEFSTNHFLDNLKESLSLTLVHFYPLAGQFVTEVDEERHQCQVFVDCSKGPGARFIYATLEMTISDILSPTDVPLVVKSFFDHDRAVNHDGHTRSLLSVQVTELLDGIFIGCSFNHAIADGTPFWQFWNMWSEIHQAKGRQISLSQMPVYKRWCPDEYNPGISLPFTHPDEFESRFEAPLLRERIFHFSSESIAKLKAKANQENNTTKISSFQALSALVWRSIVRARNLPHDQVTNCGMSTNNRHRLDPPLPRYYFGNSMNAMKTTTTAGELLEHNLGWAALLLHHSVVNFTDKPVRNFLNRWLESPFVYHLDTLFDSISVMMGSSPRFDVYGNEFGLGKAVAARSGYANKFVGKVTSYPGREGGGSVDLEICLPPDSMRALETDKEFMAAVSLPSTGY